jgi:hypothetical protein
MMQTVDLRWAGPGQSTSPEFGSTVPASPDPKKRASPVPTTAPRGLLMADSFYWAVLFLLGQLKLYVNGKKTNLLVSPFYMSG